MRSGLPFNVDLIYGAAGETFDAVGRARSTRRSPSSPAHVSAYGLTVEAGTPLADAARRHPDDDDQADKYLLATDRLGAAGFEWYEISNWAGRATSAGTTSCTGPRASTWRSAARRTVTAHGRRYWNVRTPERYVDGGRGRALGRGRRARSSTPTPAASRACSWRCAPRDGVPVEAFDPADLAGPCSTSSSRSATRRRTSRVVLTVPGPAARQRGRAPPALTAVG